MSAFYYFENDVTIRVKEKYMKGIIHENLNAHVLCAMCRLSS